MPPRDRLTDVESLLPRRESNGALQEQTYAGYGSRGDEALQKKHEQHTEGLADYKSLATILTVVLIGDTARGIVFPTLSSYVILMGGNKSTLGAAVAGFSLGRVIASPLLGKWSTQYGCRRVLAAALSALSLGAILYALASSTAWLIAAQVMMGLGSGTLGVTRGYVADRTPNARRTGMLAMLTAVQYGGFACTPLLGAMLCRAIGDGAWGFGHHFALGGWVRLEWSQFTAPGYLLAGASAAVALLVWLCLEDAAPAAKATPPRPQQQQKAVEGAVGEKMALLHQTTSSSKTPAAAAAAAQAVAYGDVEDLEGAAAAARNHDAQQQNHDAPLTRSAEAAILGAFLLNVACKGVIATYETLGANYAINTLSLSPASAGLFFATFGAGGVVALLSMGALSRRFNDVQLIVGGAVVMLLSCALLVVPTQGGGLGYAGFVASIFLQYSIGYPIGHSAVLGMFSKIVGKRAQGALQGLFASAGSVARIAFPLAVGTVAQLLGVHVVFALLCVVLSVTIVILLVYRRTYLAYCEDD
ncbi:major facilitator superfamily domain-containing protein [Tribonema minus]|uniref:Major facilitator superfamily domain-containing protein n=1 Tax=Tribonema minus TaxID=303371 RepID=A0A836C8M5_9STRA|nr:major facilitator superfamily domain-containing protein [Tribonema minus]